MWNAHVLTAIVDFDCVRNAVFAPHVVAVRTKLRVNVHAARLNAVVAGPCVFPVPRFCFLFV